MLILLDNRNAILKDNTSGTIFWQSFLHPTDTFLLGMKMNNNLKLTSWKNEDDPGNGVFTFQQDPENLKHHVIWNNRSTTYHWRSGSGSMNDYDSDPMFTPAYYLLTGDTTRTIYNKSKNGSLEYHNASLVGNFSRMVMSYTGIIQYFSWDVGSKAWVLGWQEPQDNCSIYQVCGPYGLCNVSNNDLCTCLHGFELISPGDSKSGCKRIYDRCDINVMFIKLTTIKADNPTLTMPLPLNETDCKKRCLEDGCRCQAYASRGRSGPDSHCWIWNSEVTNLQTSGSNSISIRVSNLEKGSQNTTEVSPPETLSSSSSFLLHIMISASAILVILLSCIMVYIYYKRRVKGNQERNCTLPKNEVERRDQDLLDLDHSRAEDTEGIEVPFFELKDILTATDNFSDANKLGQGGFGPVYKGLFPGGLQVAVKRLSCLSGQGLKEFKNEVVVIAKLQHRNLVRLLGYCMKGNEKILLYEYMPNRSLDFFIFDRTPRISLDWEKRFEIIIGIARGLLYLHQDSRLRIIHRDLKTSNILLDEEMEPKISDFGLAKIVTGKEMEATTNRVVGTYGYMAPEYALDGLFSTKSDVFSFGVIVLEIISGKRNTGFCQPQRALSLLGYAWSLWQEDIPFELMDQTLIESSNSSEVLKCIIVGLLCVQEDPGDRPSMTNVVLMLGGDIASLPTPKQPAFVARKMMPNSSSSYEQDTTITNNELTISPEEGR